MHISPRAWVTLINMTPGNCQSVALEVGILRRSARTDNHPSDNKTKGTTSSEGVTRTDEKTSTDGTTDGNHLQVSGLHLLLEQQGLVGNELGGCFSLELHTTEWSALLSSRTLSYLGWKGRGRRDIPGGTWGSLEGLPVETGPGPLGLERRVVGGCDIVDTASVVAIVGGTDGSLQIATAVLLLGVLNVGHD